MTMLHSGFYFTWSFWSWHLYGLWAPLLGSCSTSSASGCFYSRFCCGSCSPMIFHLIWWLCPIQRISSLSGILGPKIYQGCPPLPAYPHSASNTDDDSAHPPRSSHYSWTSTTRGLSCFAPASWLEPTWAEYPQLWFYFSSWTPSSFASWVCYSPSIMTQSDSNPSSAWIPWTTLTWNAQFYCSLQPAAHQRTHAVALPCEHLTSIAQEKSPAGSGWTSTAFGFWPVPLGCSRTCSCSRLRKQLDLRTSWIIILVYYTIRVNNRK